MTEVLIPIPNAAAKTPGKLAVENRNKFREIALDMAMEKILAETAPTKIQGTREALTHHRQSIVGRETSEATPAPKGKQPAGLE